MITIRLYGFNNQKLPIQIGNALRNKGVPARIFFHPEMSAGFPLAQAYCLGEEVPVVTGVLEEALAENFCDIEILVLQLRIGVK